MEYRIDYGPPIPRAARSGRKPSLAALTAGFGLLFLLLVHCFWPAGQARLRQWVLPGAEKADAAFHQLADNLQSGQPLTDCVESFCRQVLDGA